uniref:Uncharacterized protein n=1 Tax=Cacopsylla melanoneura TaxID=428564 RepID=A0A8D8RNB1_9HEMI
MNTNRYQIVTCSSSATVHNHVGIVVTIMLVRKSCVRLWVKYVLIVEDPIILLEYANKRLIIINFLILLMDVTTTNTRKLIKFQNRRMKHEINLKKRICGKCQKEQR